MIPKEIINNFPEIHRSDPDMLALADTVDQMNLSLFNEILGLRYLLSPERCPASLLDNLGNFIAADIRQGDSDRLKRQKIASAVQSHKRRGTFEDDVKVRLDSITGRSARILVFQDSGDWIELAGEADDPDRFWGTFGGDPARSDAGDLGLDLNGSFAEGATPGNIYIDLHEGVTTPVLTPTQLANILLEFTDPESGIEPAYFRLFLGYIDGSGSFQTYMEI